LLHSFDFGSCQVLYDGKNTYLTSFAIYSIVNGLNVVVPKYSSKSYAARLYKYMDRGFGLYLSGFDHIPVRNSISVDNFKFKLKHSSDHCNYVASKIDNHITEDGCDYDSKLFSESVYAKDQNTCYYRTQPGHYNEYKYYQHEFGNDFTMLSNILTLNTGVNNFSIVCVNSAAPLHLNVRRITNIIEGMMVRDIFKIDYCIKLLTFKIFEYSHDKKLPDAYIMETYLGMDYHQIFKAFSIYSSTHSELAVQTFMRPFYKALVDKYDKIKNNYRQVLMTIDIKSAIKNNIFTSSINKTPMSHKEFYSGDNVPTVTNEPKFVLADLNLFN
jgi:hypothetical protein